MATFIDLTAPTSRRSFVGACATLAAALGLGAAGTSALAAGSSAEDTSAASDKTAPKVTNAFPITIKHALGETVIEQAPTRVACVSWGNQDAPLALGVAPVGFSAANYGVKEGEKMFFWTADAYEKLGVSDYAVFDDTDGVDFEAVSDTNPDLILTVYSGITQDDYDRLAKIAPVVPYLEQPYFTSWREMTTVSAQALGMKEAGEQLVADADKLIADTLAAHPNLKDKKAAFIMFNATDPSKFYVYMHVDPRAAYLEDLGLQLPDSLKELTKDEPSIAATLSSEVADQLTDLDLMVAYGDESFLEQLQADPLMGTVPCVQRGNVALIPSDSYLAGAGNPSILSIQATVEEFVQLLDDVVVKGL